LNSAWFKQRELSKESRSGTIPTSLSLTPPLLEMHDHLPLKIGQTTVEPFRKLSGRVATSDVG